MRKRVLASALLAAIAAACGGDGRITDPQVPKTLTGFAAVGIDPNTGATIETNKDDYAPGEVVHLNGRGWTPNEVVRLFMTESPDTHGDVSQEIQADSTGSFSLHFYDVQVHDIGVTFTLTATGTTSGSTATAVFRDGNFSANTNSSAVTISVGYKKFNGNASCSGVGNDTAVVAMVSTSAASLIGVGNSQSLRVTAPAVAPGGHTFVSWTNGTTTFSTNVACLVGVPGNETWTANYNVVANTAPVVSAGADAIVNEGATFSQNGSFTDPDANTWTATVNYGDGTGDQPLTLTLPAKTFSLSHVYADNGSFTVTVTVNDGTIGTSDVVGVTVNNVAPSATFTAPTSVSGGSPILLSLTSPTDPSTVDAAAGFTYAFDCGDGAGYAAYSATNNASCPTSGTGSRTVKGKIRDKDNGEREYTASVAVNNVAPIASAGGPNYSGNEGSAITITGTGSDPDGGTVTYAWSVAPNDGTCTFGNATAASTTVTCNNDGAWTLTLTVKDDENVTTTSDATLTVANVAPTATFNAPSPVNEGSPISLSLTSPIDPSTVDAANLQYAFDCGTGTGYGSFGSSSSASCPTTDNGTRTVKGKVKDDDTFTEYSASVTIDNVAPTATFNAPASVNEGSNIALSLTGAFDPSAADLAAGLKYAFDCGSGYGALTATSSATCPTTDNGTRTVKAKIQDKDNEFTEYSASVTINNVVPVVAAGADAAMSEGSTFSQNGSFTDPGADTWTATVNYGDGTGVQPLTLVGKTFALSHTYADNGTYTVTVTVNDDDTGAGTDVVSVVVSNVNPDITLLTVPLNPIAAGPSNVGVTWKFTDPGADTWTCAIDWDNGAGEVSASYVAPKSCSATASLPAGIYTVTVRVTDDDNGTDTETASTYIVVYDPNAGFVTGGGWITSPAGAYVPAPALSGKATFGFVSKYKKGQTAPDGNTEFQFHAAGMNFKSSVYEWLVVAGAKAQFKGSGTINGSGNYGFLLMAIDGQVSGGGGSDKFRIKIWDKNNLDAVVYDNQLGAAETVDPNTVLGGGSIHIQAK